MQEQPQNSQDPQQQRRRPVQADAIPRPTAGCRPSSCSAPGAADAGPPGFAELTPPPRSRPIGRRRTATCETATWNSRTNGSTARPTVREGERGRDLRSGWQLPNLIRPLPVRRRERRRRKRRLQRHWPALIEYVYQSRFVIPSQILRRYPQWLKSARTAQWQLAGLVELGLLATAPVRSTSPNFPFVYYATGRGVRLVNDTYAQAASTRRYPPGEGCKRHGLALQGILHEVLTTEFELAVRQTIGDRPDMKLLLTERRYFRRDRRLRFNDQGRSQTLVPDAGFLVAQIAERGTTTGASHNVSFASKIFPDRQGILYLVEFDNGTMPAARFGQKLRRYSRWAESDTGLRYLERLYAQFDLRAPESGFRLLVIAHDKLHAGGDQKRLAELFTQGLTLPAAMRDRLWFATAADIASHQEDSPPLAAEIWYRGRAAKAWLPAFYALPERKPNTSRLRYVAEHLPLLDRRSLFPSPTPANVPFRAAAPVGMKNEVEKVI